MCACGSTLFLGTRSKGLIEKLSIGLERTLSTSNPEPSRARPVRRKLAVSRKPQTRLL